LRVVPRRAGGVSCLIDVLPDVDAGRASRRQPFRRADQQEAVTASNVEHAFIPSPRNRIEQRVARAKLSRKAAPEHHPGGEREADRGAEKTACHEQCEQIAADRADREVAQHGGCVDSVIRLLHYRTRWTDCPAWIVPGRMTLA